MTDSLRAMRYPNGNNKDLSGMCFSKTQRPIEVAHPCNVRCKPAIVSAARLVSRLHIPTPLLGPDRAMPEL